MAKPKKPYHWFPITKNGKACPICGKQFAQSKLMLALYDGLNMNSMETMHKIPFCSDCHVPFLTDRTKKEIEAEHAGYHLETGNMNPHMSVTFLTKRTVTPPLPIRNVPKHTLLFVGEERDHACGERTLERYHGIMHGDSPVPIKITECRTCQRHLISPTDYKHIKSKCKEYIFAKDDITWSDIFPENRTIHLLNVNQYTKQTCTACGGKLEDKSFYFKNDKSATLVKKNMKKCTKCNTTFGRSVSFKEIYSRYDFSLDLYQEESYRKDGKVVKIKTGDFLTRHNLSNCIRNGHSIEDITARVRIVDKSGNESDYDVPATRCDTCGKLFLLETEYRKIKERGIPLCSVVENEYWRTTGNEKHEWSETDAKGSVMYVHGYNVAVANDLTVQQRQTILRTLITDGILTKSEICSHLDTLIKRAGNQPVLKNAKTKWQNDRSYIEKYDSTKETIQVSSIKHRTYKRRPET